MGGQPTVTYNPRPGHGVDQRVRDFLDERYRILCITGPTKSGKTVLAREVIRNSIKVSGGELASIDDFWNDIVDSLAAYTDEGTETSNSDEESSSDSYGGAVKVAGTGVDGKHEAGSKAASARKHTRSRTRDPRRVAKAELLKTKPPVVLDDFHHIEPTVQRQIVRGVKDLVYEGVPFIFIAVPHRSYDVIRAEKEMQGRVEDLRISLWEQRELEDIATRGFDALNLECPKELAERMAAESYGSPLLMQNFCLKICKANGIAETLAERNILSVPDDLDPFFRSVADDGEGDDTYRRLAQGPRQRADRIRRRLKTGETTDIYGAVLAAIASTGPSTELDWTEIRTALRRVLADDPPQRQEFTRVLEKMSEIARDMVWEAEHERLSGDPVLEWDSNLGKLHISDPFFAYQLRWVIRSSDGA